MFYNVAAWIRKISQRGRRVPITKNSELGRKSNAKAKDAWRGFYRPELEPLEDRTLPSITITDFTVPSSGYQGAPLSFSAAANDTDPGTLTYSWDFGNNLTAQGA